jgi:hypothetical protein
MRISRAIILSLLISCVALASASDKVKVKIAIDEQKVLDIHAWSLKAKKLAEDWFPKIQKILGATNKDPKVTLSFERYDGIAGTAGDHIAFNVGWIEKHPDDYGMVIHELVHVVEAYPKYDPSWLIEGFADYIRYFVFEPERHVVKVDPKRANYKNGYGDAAAFVDYLEKKNPGFIKKAHQAMRDGSYKDANWIDWTGKSVDDNWKDFIASITPVKN